METCIVIGAGIAGLEMAALLSKYFKVKVFEKSSVVGGRAMVVEKEGFLLDFGGHPVRYGSKSSIAQTMRDIGRPVKFIIPGNVITLFADGSKDIFPSSVGTIFKTKMVPISKTLKMFLKFILTSKKKIRNLLGKPLDEYIKENNFEEKMIRFIKMTSGALMVCPFLERVSTGEFIENVKETLKVGSVEYIKGGWKSFFEPLEEVIHNNNGEIHLKSKVSEIIVEKQKAIGVRIDQQIYKADLIINTVPIQKLFQGLLDLDLVPKKYKLSCDNLRYTTGISIDFALSKPISDICGIMMLEDPYGYGFIPSNLSPEIVPKGKSLMTFFTPLHKEDLETEEKKKFHYKRLKDLITKHFPRIDKYTEFERPIYFKMVDGVECAWDQHRLIRPGNKVPNIKNLYLTGDSAGGHGSGGDIGHTSVRECFKLIKKEFNLI